MKSLVRFIVLIVKYVVSILLYEIFQFYIQIRSMYNCFNVHQCALVRPTEFAICCTIRKNDRLAIKIMFLIILLLIFKDI